MKILLLDIENAPNLAHVWKFWKENVGVDQVVEDSYLLSFSCKWLEDTEVFYFDRSKYTERGLVNKLWVFLDQADIVIANNGDRFDLT